MGYSSQALPTTYLTLASFLQYQDPMIVLIETQSLFSAVETSRFRRTVDQLKLSAEKIKTVVQLKDHSVLEDSLLSYIFPIIKYHTRYKELTEADFQLNNKDYHSLILGQVPMKRITESINDDVTIDAGGG
jgi:hypothetical protein